MAILTISQALKFDFVEYVHFLMPEKYKYSNSEVL